MLAAASVLASILVCGAAVLVSVRAPTVRQAAQLFAYGSTAVFFGAIFGFQALPAAWRVAFLARLGGTSLPRTEVIGGLILVALDLIVLAVARQRFQRTRLILD